MTADGGGLLVDKGRRGTARVKSRKLLKWNQTYFVTGYCGFDDIYYLQSTDVRTGEEGL